MKMRFPSSLALLACCAVAGVSLALAGTLRAEDDRPSSLKGSDQQASQSSEDSQDEATDSQQQSNQLGERQTQTAQQQNNQSDNQRQQPQQLNNQRRQQQFGQQQTDQYGNRRQATQAGQTQRRQVSNFRGESNQDAYQSQQQPQRRQLDAQSLGLSLNDEEGRLTVDRVSARSQARQAGLRENDEIISVGGREISSTREFNRILSSNQGRRVAVVVDRDGREQTIWLGGQPARRNNNEQYSQFGNRNYQTYQDEGYGQQRSSESQAFLGVILDDRYPNLAVVRQVYENSPAAEAGLRQGDTIISLNGQRVRSPQELSQDVMQLQPGAEIRLQFTRPQVRNVQIYLTTREGSQQQRQAMRQSRDRDSQGARSREYDGRSLQDRANSDRSARDRDRDQDEDQDQAQSSDQDRDSDNQRDRDRDRDSDDNDDSQSSDRGE
jgi:C-terminal processing protease CtpA/Prc